MKKYIKQLFSESFIYGLSSIITKFIGIFLVPIYTRIFNPDDYGVLSIVNTTITFLMIFVVMALDNAAHRWFWDDENNNGKKSTISSWFWCCFLISVLILVIIYVFKKEIGFILFKNNMYDQILLFAALTVPLNVAIFVLTNWFRMQRKPIPTILFTLGVNLLNILITIYFVVSLKMGIAGIYKAQIIAFLVGTIVSIFILRDWINPKYFSKIRLQEMFKYSMPLLPASLAFWIINLSGVYFVKFYNSLSEVGLFQVGSLISSGVLLVTGSFQQAWGPFAFSISNDENCKEVYAKVLLFYMFIACLFATGLSIFAEEIISIFATKNYIEAKNVIIPLSFTHVVIGLSYIAVLGAQICKTNKHYGIGIIISAFLVTVLNLSLVPKFGKEGAALAIFFGQSIVPILVFYYSQKLYFIPYNFRKAILCIIISIFYSLTAHFIFIEDIIVKIILKILIMIVYFISLTLIFKISKKFLLELKSGFRTL